MGSYFIEGVSSIGVVQETPAHRLPPEAWTRARNVRFVDKRAQRFGGHQSVMGTPTVPPGAVMVVDNAGEIFWIYMQAAGASSKVYAYNGGVHTDISQGAGYNVANYRDWNHDVFQGIPILNSGSGIPQYWASPNVAVDLADIPAWPAATTAAVVKGFGNYLVAMNITDGTGGHPHRVLWSDGAGTGELPASWDVTNPAFDADHRDLGDINSGRVVDGIALRDFFVVYKNESTWLMRYIGGTLIFSVKPQMKTTGILAQRCSMPIAIASSKLEVAFSMTGEDLGTFDGQEFQSVVEDKDRKFLVSDIDPVNFDNSFVLDNRAQDEAWFCYPENGATDPSVACVWNYKENTITFRDFVGTDAANGSVESATGATWATVIGTWATQGPAKWQDATRRKVIVADQAHTLLQQLESGDTFNGVSFDGTLERVGLAVTGTDRQGNPIVNYNSRKILHRIWPKATGGRILIQVGGADTPDEDDVVWGAGVIFDPAEGKRFCDPAGDGDPLNYVYNAVRFTFLDDMPTALEGYMVEVEELSEI